MTLPGVLAFIDPDIREQAPWILLGGWAAALLFLWLWWNRLRFARLLADVPAVPISGVFVGLIETNGTVECDAPVTGGITGVQCVYHRWSVAEHWSRTETYTDSKGNTHTRTVSGSDTVASGGETVDMRIRDATGAIMVRTRGASWTPKTTFARTVGRGDPLYASKAPNAWVSGSTGRRTFTETAVPLASQAWVFGHAYLRPDCTGLEIAAGGEEQVFMISLAGERTHFGWAIAMSIVGCVLGVAAAGAAGLGLAPTVAQLLPPLEDGRETLIGIAASAFAFSVLVALFWSVLVRNGAVRVRNRWERAASLVDVELKRRSDLIPNVVAVTAGFAVHESGLQESMAKLRAGGSAEQVFLALAEAYPTLRADGAFLALQQQLTDTESRIAQARRFELQSREALLARLQTFPAGLIARLMGVATPPPPLASPAPRPSSPGNPPPG